MSLHILLIHPDKAGTARITYTDTHETIYIPASLSPSGEDITETSPYIFPKDIKDLQNRHTTAVENDKRFNMPGVDEAINIEEYWSVYNEERRKKKKPEIPFDVLVKLIDWQNAALITRMKYAVYLTHNITGAMPNFIGLDISWFGMASGDPDAAAITTRMFKSVIEMIEKMKELKKKIPFLG